MPKKNPSAIRTSFSKRLAVYISAALIVLLICFEIISYAITRINAESNFIYTAQNGGELISDMLDDHLQYISGRLDIVVENENLGDFVAGMNVSAGKDDIKSIQDFSEMTRNLSLICGSDTIVSSWIISEQNGMLVSGSGEVLFADEYGLNDEYWYDRYLSGIAIDKYICTYSEQGIFGTDVVSVIVPVSKNGSVFAFCGLEVTADSVFDILSQYSFNRGTYPLIAAGGEVIHKPSTAEFDQKFNLNDPPFMKLLSSSTVYSNGLDSYIAESGDEVYYYCKSNGISGWNVIVLFDSSEINGGVYSVFMRQLMILLCMSALLVIYVINILHRESSPLHEIRDCTKEITSGNYNYRIKNIAKNELGTVAQNVNRIAEIMQAKTSVINSYNTTDILTGLKNRSAMYERLNDIIQTREEGRSRFALMFVDIDNFRWLNETLGHNYGDEVLSRFGTIIKEQLPNDMSVFRFSGDEFIIIKEFDKDYSEVYTAIENLHNRFNSPIEIMNDKIYIKFSIGVSIFPDDDVTPERLLRNAETALHRAKDSGKDRVAFYTNTSRDRSAFSKAAIARSLSDALQNGELFLHYQPIVSAATRDIHGFEVLLRWISPEFGVVPPAEFIKVAEESGDIVKIGTWIFESACRTLKQINESIDPNIIMSINVSPVQLKRDDYIDHVKQVIDITMVNPKNIQLEITESTLIDFTDSNSGIINEINELGISLALDDFGTGYSSLNYLKNFPIKCLKIDKSFIDEINNDQRDYAITDSIIDLVHGLGIHTVAEGIETVGQYNFLMEMKCDYIQGFLMSKPLDERDAIEFLESYDALHKPDERQLRENEKQLADEREQQRLEKEKENKSGAAVTEDFIISK